jgi:hypothetical protein
MRTSMERATDGVRRAKSRGLFVRKITLFIVSWLQTRGVIWRDELS